MIEIPHDAGDGFTASAPKKTAVEAGLGVDGLIIGVGHASVSQRGLAIGNGSLICT